MRLLFSIIILFTCSINLAQEDEKIYNLIILDSIVIMGDNGFDIKEFMTKVKQDSSFYRAFKNLHYFPHHIEGKIWAYNKKLKESAFEHISANQIVTNEKTWQHQEIVAAKGKMRNKKQELKFVTAQLYYEIFFPKDTLLIDRKLTNVHQEEAGRKKSDQYKRDLKIMMFNPGDDVDEVPIVGKKMSIFDDDMTPYYDYKISKVVYNGRSTYLFSTVAKKENKPDDTVIKYLHTHFDIQTGMVLSRKYELKYNSLLFQFHVFIEVKNKIENNEILPESIIYSGNWDVPFKSQESLKFIISAGNYGL